ncbi:Uncharacterised protein [Nocardia farcinica]|uniref:hypothetical protein n=1 Tax=Nocardia farcinica TaxID=37329 RepID=UPI0010265208|nr:hypothetical protein [Nocardia farcinica]VFA96162.1 Uncharacterised protein [Nocardia farcinica]
MPGASALWAWDVYEPVRDFSAAAVEFMAGEYVTGAFGMAALLIPAAWLAATLLHARRRVQLATVGLASPARTERALWAQAQREQRAAARLSRRRLPLTTGGLNPDLVIGRLAVEHDQAPPRGVLRQLAGRTETRLILPWINVAEHLSTVASSGSGKTTLMRRVLVSWYATTWKRHRQWWRRDRPGRPLAIVVDCNGGPESRKVAAGMRTWFEALGVPAERIGIFPDDVSLGLWHTTSRDDLRSILSAMVSGGSTPTTDTEKYFHEIRETLIHLVVDAPAQVKVIDGVPTPIGENPPRSWIEFLSRLDPARLARLWGGQLGVSPWTGVPGRGDGDRIDPRRQAAGHQLRARRIRQPLPLVGRRVRRRQAADRFRCRLHRPGGVKTPDRARAQFGALGTMFEQLADKEHGPHVADGRGRVLGGLGWQDPRGEVGRAAAEGRYRVVVDRAVLAGLGHDDDSRSALVAAASGGSLIGRSTDPETISKIYGTRHKFELSRKLVSGNRDGDEGNVQSSDQYLLPPNRLRAMQKGDVVQVSGGRARWGRVSPLDDAELKRLRPLPGLDRFTTAETDTDALAPVIDLTHKRRPA